MITAETLLVERRGSVGLVTVNRPAVLNALNTRALADLDRAMDDLGGSAEVGAVVITGAGDKAFVAGADIQEITGLDGPAAKAYSERGQATFERIARLGKPVVAAINGFALGGGCELAMACTLRIAAEHARLGLPEIRLGAIPGFGGTQRLPRLIGRARALEMILTGHLVSATEALGIGLVHKVVPAAALLNEALDLAGKLAAAPALALRFAIEAVESGADLSMADGCRLETSLFGLAAATEDMREGMTAFLEKRAPSFKGR